MITNQSKTRGSKGKTPIVTRGEWYKNSVILQVYPRTFYDSNNDGVGDLRGIIQKLDYVKSLNVDCLYINPFYLTPPDSKDGGYDVIDHTAVDPVFGTIEDFETLIKETHARGLKVFVDQVWNHTSDKHPWFLASSDPDHPDHEKYKDWYLWENPKHDENGNRLAPNNWLSKFNNESAWTWCEKRQQYYFHNFLAQQPEVNFRNQELKRAILEIAEFWMKKGVDGMRLDAVGFFFYDKQLRDNPWREDANRLMDGVQYGTDYNKQHLRYNINQPESKEFMKEVRVLANKHDVVLLAEVVCSENSMEEALSFIGDDKCHFAYTGKGLRYDKFEYTTAIEYIELLINYFPDGRLCLCYGSHDFPAAMTRLGAENASREFGITLASFFYSLPGSAILFQTDALGLPQAELKPKDMRCPVGRNLYPVHHGRDGTRTPIPWLAKGKNAGFTKEGVKPYLPVDPKHKALAVEVQDNDPDSYLNNLRCFLKWRKGQHALLHGNLEPIASNEPVVVYLRKAERQSLLAVFNMSNEKQSFMISAGFAEFDLEPKYGFGSELSGGEVQLDRWSFIFIELSETKQNSKRTVKNAKFLRKDVVPTPFQANPAIIYWT